MTINVINEGARPGEESTLGFSLAFQKATQKGEPVWVPPGVYKVHPDVLQASDGQTITGPGHNHARLISTAPELSGVGLRLANDCDVSGVYISGYQEGINNGGYWNKIHDIRASGNTVGVHLEKHSYITKLYNSMVTFNRGVGVLAGTEVYQADVHHNVIDNNAGVGVGCYGSTLGMSLADNTIEGNRDYDTGFGVGVLVRSTNLARFKIDGNWFEANGSAPGSTDVFMMGQHEVPGWYDLGRSMVDQLIPAPYQHLFEGNCGTGAVSISRNGFIFTPNSAVVAGWRGTAISVKENQFKGKLDVYNKHVVLNFTPSALSHTTTVTIADNSYNNTDNNKGINPQVETGVRGTIVHAPFRAGKYPGITYNGTPLFT